jgi:hypothetical protein
MKTITLILLVLLISSASGTIYFSSIAEADNYVSERRTLIPIISPSNLTITADYDSYHRDRREITRIVCFDFDVLIVDPSNLLGRPSSVEFKEGFRHRMPYGWCGEYNDIPDVNVLRITAAHANSILLNMRRQMDGLVAVDEDIRIIRSILLVDQVYNTRAETWSRRVGVSR